MQSIVQDKQVRIALIHDRYKPIQQGSIGGEDNLVQTELIALSERNLDIGIFLHQNYGPLKKLRQFRAQTYGSPLDFLEKIKKFKPDVIHCHNLSLYSGISWMDKVNIPIVLSLHNYRIYCPVSISWRDGKNCFDCRDHGPLESIKHGCSLKMGMTRVLRDKITLSNKPEINKVTRYIATSELIKNSISPIVQSKKISILRNPATQILNPTKTTRTKWLFAGRFTYEKGILELIRIWPDSEFLDIAGDGPILNRVKESISKKPNIQLIGTFAPNIKSIYDQYIGLIFPSIWMEGSPLVVIDSLSNGSPVIAFEGSGGAELVKITNGGLIIDSDADQSALLQSIEIIKKKRDIYSLNAINSMKSQFSLDIWCNNLLKILSLAISEFK